MEKINGFSKEEVINLIDFLKNGKASGIPLSKLFEDYGKKYNRAKGSVRNFYYQLLKGKEKNSYIRELLKKADLKAEKIEAFTTKETQDLIRGILLGKAKGQSVRRTIKNLANNSGKLMLRMQNKYRNILKDHPDLIEIEMLKLKQEFGGDLFKSQEIKPIFSDFAIKRLQREINALYNKLSQSLKRENGILKEKLIRLEGENLRLKRLFEESMYKEQNKSCIFFEREGDKQILS